MQNKQQTLLQPVYDVRRANLRMLIGEYEGVLQLGVKLGHKSGSYLSQLAGPRPTRDVSEKLAREFEATLGLPAGWLDVPRTS